jgi:hypothetical protein
VDESISDKIGLVLDNPDLWYSKAKESELVIKITKAYYETGTTPTRSFIPYCSASTQPTTRPRSTLEEWPITGSKPPSTPTPTCYVRASEHSEERTPRSGLRSASLHCRTSSCQEESIRPDLWSGCWSQQIGFSVIFSFYFLLWGSIYYSEYTCVMSESTQMLLSTSPLSFRSSSI